MRPKSEIFNFELLVPSKVQLRKSGTVFQPRMISSLRNSSSFITYWKTVCDYAIEENDMWSQVFDQTFEVSATDVSCSIERIADTLVKQLPREKGQVSPDY